MFKELIDIENKYGIKINEGESFKQAYYSGKITDSVSCILDKIELTIKHYSSKDVILTTYESDETSPYIFCFVVVSPILI
ncbi:hypothetical protein [Gilliamella apicola]|uniref:hypothetical protein n=1 Tax=Gilliamella apicola TaxID=1196095 RepID=UPI002FEE3D57